MLVLLSGLIVAAAVLWAGSVVARALAARGNASDHTAHLLALFAPGIAAVAENPRALLAWQPMAVTARNLFPAEFTALDRASGGTFPFTAGQIENAHERCTTEWLAWEANHDAEYKLKKLTLEHELDDQAMQPYGRGRLEAVEREKLERYQRRYEDYTRTARALQALLKKS